MDISVIIPCYNREDTIKRSIDSIFNQTIFVNSNIDYEIIIVDDGSTDNSVKVINMIEDLHIRLVCLEENFGGNYARNEGVKFSSGTFIAFQDSDDVWLTNKLEVQLNALKSNQVDIVFSSLISQDNDKESIVPHGIEEGIVMVEDFLDFNKMSTQVIFGKRHCFVEQPFDNEIKRFQDWELALRLITRYKLFFIKEPLAIQYIQSNSITRNNTKAYDSLLIIEEKHRILFNNNKKYYAKLFETIAYYANILNVDSNSYLKKALNEHFSYKVFIKYLLNKISVYKLIIHFRN